MYATTIEQLPVLNTIAIITTGVKIYAKVKKKKTILAIINESKK